MQTEHSGNGSSGGCIVLGIIFAVALVALLWPMFQPEGAIYETVNTAAGVISMEATAVYERAHPTPTPLPTPTPTPMPTPTPTPLPPVKVVIGTLWDFWGCAVGVVVLIIGAGMAWEAKRLIAKQHKKISQSPTGEVVYQMPGGELAITAHSLSDHITPQPSKANDLLSKFDRIVKYLRTGKVPPVPDRRAPALSQNDAADPRLLAHMGVARTQAESLAVGLSNTLPEDDRLKRIEATKRAGLRPSAGHSGEAPWRVTKPEDIPVSLPDCPVGFLEAAQERYLEQSRPQNNKVQQVIDGR
jgi:hypothetical protein